VVWSFWEAVAGSLFVATTAVSSAKVAVKESGEVGRSAEDTALRNPLVNWGKACEFSVDFYNEVAISQIGVKDKEVVQWE
jgi:hypothetical protein